jgi:hypothetical protein
VAKAVGGDYRGLILVAVVVQVVQVVLALLKPEMALGRVLEVGWSNLGQVARWLIKRGGGA